MKDGLKAREVARVDSVFFTKGAWSVLRIGLLWWSVSEVWMVNGGQGHP